MRLKNIILSTILIISSFIFVGCSGEKKVEPTPEQKFIAVFEKAINNRWDESNKIDSKALQGDSHTNAVIKMIEDEINTLKPAAEILTDVTLKEIANNYIKGSELQLESFKTNDSSLIWKYEEEANNLRKPALIELVDKYGVVIKEEHQQNYKDFKESAMIINKENEAKEYADKLALEMTFTKIEQEYGEAIYETIIENKSDITFDTLSFEIKCKDKDGIVIATESIYLQTFEPGVKEKCKIFPFVEGVETLVVTANNVYLD